MKSPANRHSRPSAPPLLREPGRYSIPLEDMHLAQHWGIPDSFAAPVQDRICGHCQERHLSEPRDELPQAVAARDAASLVVLRRAGFGWEALMGLRGARHRFMPNRLVFPGGAVDPNDNAALVAAELRPATLALLQRAASPALARALAVAAARELEEETGLTLGVPPDLSGLRYLCRALTPAGNPVRFDARFLVVDSGHVGGTLAGSGELEGLRWYGLDEALALDLALVTREVMLQLVAWIAMPESERDARQRTAVFDDRTWREE